jgi:hypothetical protein
MGSCPAFAAASSVASTANAVQGSGRSGSSPVATPPVDQHGRRSSPGAASGTPCGKQPGWNPNPNGVPQAARCPTSRTGGPSTTRTRLRRPACVTRPVGCASPRMARPLGRPWPGSASARWTAGSRACGGPGWPSGWPLWPGPAESRPDQVVVAAGPGGVRDRQALAPPRPATFFGNHGHCRGPRRPFRRPSTGPFGSGNDIAGLRPRGRGRRPGERRGG